MTTYGLTTDGFITKTLNTVRDELTTRLREAFGTSIRLDDRSIFGQIAGIVSELAALVWEQLEVVNSSQDPDKAVGAALDALCTLTGTFRPAATYSAVTLTLTGTPLSLVVSGSKVKTVSTNVSFETTADATIELLDSWTSLTAYTIGDRVTNAGNAYQCVTAGASASSGGPTTTGETVVDGSVEWTYLGAGTGAIDVLGRSSDAGTIIAYARDIAVLDSAAVGWEGVINLLDATPGREVASDEELRLLREAELAGAGNTPIDALRADLLDVPGTVAVTVFVNNTDETNSDGMPPHSVEAMVRAVDPPPDTFEQDMFDALLANVAAGIRTHGTTPGTATDSQGTEHVVKFSYPDNKDVYVTMDIIVDEDEFPTDGADLIKEAIVTWGDAQANGKNVVASAIAAQAFTIAGVLDVSSVKIGLTSSPSSSTTIAIGLRELAVYDSSRITINVTTGIP